MQKLYDRAVAKLNHPVSQPVRVGEKAKTFEDVRVFADPDSVSEIKDQEFKIKYLISCLANGEARGRFEKLSGYKNVFSMRLTKGDRFVFEILEGDMLRGIRALRILAAKNHYEGLDGRVSRRAAPLEYSWVDEGDAND